MSFLHSLMVFTAALTPHRFLHTLQYTCGLVLHPSLTLALVVVDEVTSLYRLAIQTDSVAIVNY